MTHTNVEQVCAYRGAYNQLYESEEKARDSWRRLELRTMIWEKYPTSNLGSYHDRFDRDDAVSFILNNKEKIKEILGQ